MNMKYLFFQIALVFCTFSQTLVISDLKNTTNTCDELFICKNLFLSKATEHANYRISNVHDDISNPRIALLEDIYSQFPDSTVMAVRLKCFLKFIHDSWAQPPRFIQFIGQPVPKDSAETDYSCPTYYNPIPECTGTDTSYIPVDDWLVKFENIGIPFEGIGRIPAKTIADYSSAIEKIIIFESDFSLKKLNALSIYGDDQADTVCRKDMDFYKWSEGILPHIPQYLIHNTLLTYRYINDSFSANRFTEDTIAKTINSGAAFISYFGRGGPNKWSGASILLTDSIIAKLHNDFPPILLAFTSNTNRFQEPEKSLGTKMLLSSGNGAVASIGAPNWNQYIGELEKFQFTFWSFFSEYKHLGSLLYIAKSLVRYESIDQINLLGDPALLINIDSLFLDGPDTISAEIGKQFQVSGNSQSISNGKVIALTYGIYDKFEDTTRCGSFVEHFSNRPLLDSTAIDIINGQFSNSFVFNDELDSVIPLKIVFFASNSGKLLAGVKYVIKGTSNSTIKDFKVSNKAPSLTFYNHKGNVIVSANEMIVSIDLFSLNGRILHVVKPSFIGPITIPILVSGISFLRVNFKHGFMYQKLQNIR